MMLALSACGSSDNVVTSKVGNVTEKEKEGGGGNPDLPYFVCSLYITDGQ